MRLPTNADNRSPVPATVPAATEPLDQQQLGSVRAVLGEERTGRLLALFAQELASRRSAILLAVSRSDLAAASAEAHSLKGASLNLGGRAVGRPRPGWKRH